MVFAISSYESPKRSLQKEMTTTTNIQQEPAKQPAKGKRILYVYQGAYPWDVRVDKMTSALATAGYEVLVLCRWRGEEKKRDEFNGIVIWRVGSQEPSWKSQPTSFNPFWKKAIRRAVEEFKPHLIIPREILLAEACAEAARGRIPIVMDMAEHYPAAMKSWKKYHKNILLRALVYWMEIPKWVERKSVAVCDGIITVCHENSERLYRDYNFSIDRQCVVHNTPRLEDFAEVANGIVHDRESLVFGHHGFMTPERNLEMFVRAFALAGRDNGFKLSLAGEGESHSSVREEIKMSGMSDRVLLREKYNSEELSLLYSETDIGVVPYWTDEFRNHTIPNKLFDYLACGKPVLVSNSHPLKRIVEETKAGIVVDCSNENSFANGLIELSEMDLASLSQNALSWAEHKYNWAIDSHAMLEFLSKFL